MPAARRAQVSDNERAPRCCLPCMTFSERCGSRHQTASACRNTCGDGHSTNGWYFVNPLWIFIISYDNIRAIAVIIISYDKSCPMPPVM